MSRGEIVPESAVRFVRLLPAPPAKVWQFLTDTASLAQWYGEGVIEPRDGGTVSLMGGHIRGVVTAWRANTFLAYSWNVFSPGESISRWPVSYLEFTLTDENSSTRLMLVHRPIPTDMQPQTLMGWHTMLDLIEAGLKGQFPARADIIPQNATRYGVDLTKLKG